MQRIGRGRESAVFDHRDEVFQLTSFHRVSVTSSCRLKRQRTPA
jgi:hypothetical protein